MAGGYTSPVLPLAEAVEMKSFHLPRQISSCVLDLIAHWQRFVSQLLSQPGICVPLILKVTFL